MNSVVNAINSIHTAIWITFLVLIALLFFRARLLNQPVIGPMVEALNAVRMNVWMVVIIAAGVILCCCGQKEQGSNLIIGAFAILRGESSPAQSSAAHTASPTSAAPAADAGAK